MKNILCACLALIALPSAALAFDECADASIEQMEISINEGLWFPKAVSEALGPGNTTFDFDYFEQCRAMVPVARKRLEYVTKIIEADEAAARACGEELGRPSEIEGRSPTEMRAILKEYIAVCGDEGD
jgi:hypothetical protein